VTRKQQLINEGTSFSKNNEHINDLYFDNDCDAGVTNNPATLDALKAKLAQPRSDRLLRKLPLIPVCRPYLESPMKIGGGRFGAPTLATAPLEERFYRIERLPALRWRNAVPAGRSGNATRAARKAAGWPPLLASVHRPGNLLSSLRGPSLPLQSNARFAPKPAERVNPASGQNCLMCRSEKLGAVSLE
jgi:hypothetical protein